MNNKITREHLEAKVQLVADLLDQPLGIRMGNRSRGVSYFITAYGVNVANIGRTRPEAAHYLEGMRTAGLLLKDPPKERKAS